jgi:hypothetical protein
MLYFDVVANTYYLIIIIPLPFSLNKNKMLYVIFLVTKHVPFLLASTKYTNLIRQCNCHVSISLIEM